MIPKDQGALSKSKPAFPSWEVQNKCVDEMMRAGMKKESRVRVSKNGELQIPAALRKTMGIFAGEEVVLRFEDNELHISGLKGRFVRAQRLVRRYAKPGTSLSDELIPERRGAKPAS
jgi:AbrB family looped-hinge helix DNA binding protein